MPIVTVWPTPKRVADGEHHVAHVELFRVAEGDRVELAVGLDLQHREIGFRVASDDTGGQFAPVVEGPLDLVGGLDHVVVGEHIAFGRDDDAGAKAGGALLGRLSRRSPKKWRNRGRRQRGGAGLSRPLLVKMHHRRRTPLGGFGVGGGGAARRALRRRDGFLDGDGGQQASLTHSGLRVTMTAAPPEMVTAWAKIIQRRCIVESATGA